MTKICLIVAMDRMGLIGQDGSIPWYLPADLKHFKEVTWGKPVIMGRKTSESILAKLGKPLPGRYNIVMTNTDEGVRSAFLNGCDNVAHSVEEAVDFAGYIAPRMGVDRAFVIGGAAIYKAFLDAGVVDELHITEVDAILEGDTYFPSYDINEWRCVYKERCYPDSRNQYPYTFERYLRR